MTRYIYQGEKFGAARRALMLPHSEGEARSISSALHECSVGLYGIRDHRLPDEEAQGWVDQVRAFLDTKGIDNPGPGGAWHAKALRMTDDEKLELGNAIDELAYWFDRYEEDL